MEFKDISPELREKAKACTSPEEMLALAKHEGYKLSEEELVAVAGGGGWGSCSSLEECRRQSLGDTREDIEPGKAHADFINGVVDGGEFE
jgi:predicted ribosomally synthesized peptide with nif11-like leader